MTSSVLVSQAKGMNCLPGTTHKPWTQICHACPGSGPGFQHPQSM